MTPNPSEEVRNPETTAARLAELAVSNPELHAWIQVHPNVYPGLLQWIAEHTGPAYAPIEFGYAQPVPASARPATRRRPAVLIWVSAAIVIAAIAVVLLVVYIPKGGAPTPPIAAPSPTPTPTVYPIPEGCPTAEEINQAWGDPGPTAIRGDWVAVDASTLGSQLPAPLPDGGCAFISGRTFAANNKPDLMGKSAIVYYFNQDDSHVSAITDWVVGLGGAQAADAPGHYGLPDAVTGWNNNYVDFDRNDDNFIGFLSGALYPGYLQPGMRTVSAYLSFGAATADAIIAGGPPSGGASAPDPRTSLSRGLSVNFERSLDLVSEDRYSVHLDISGSLSPFASDAANEPPGSSTRC